MTGVTTSTAGS